jgi:hypothetical protein
MANENIIIPYSRKNKLGVREFMEDGISYVTIESHGEEIRMTMSAFRHMNKVWNEKGWDQKWDTIKCTDECFEEEE